MNQISYQMHQQDWKSLTVLNQYQFFLYRFGETTLHIGVWGKFYSIKGNVYKVRIDQALSFHLLI